MECRNNRGPVINECRNESDFELLVYKSHQKPVFLFKHSTGCGISVVAWREFGRFAKKAENAEYWHILVRENRPTSLTVAKKTGIKHQSPQVILFVDGYPVWNDSHKAITAATLEKQLRAFGPE